MEDPVIFGKTILGSEAFRRVEKTRLLGACGDKECRKQPNKKQFIQYTLHNTKVEKTLKLSNKKLN